MEKLTDDETIKALEICGDCGHCTECPFDDLGGIDKCMHTLIINALDLINRQKAEIERLKKSLDNMTDALVKTDEACRKAGTEAIKEFAERWKEMPSVMNCEYEWAHTDIDNLVKEMVGE